MKDLGLILRFRTEEFDKLRYLKIFYFYFLCFPDFHVPQKEKSARSIKYVGQTLQLNESNLCVRLFNT